MKTLPAKFKPMLAATYEEGKTELTFPLLMSPKLDGYRAVGGPWKKDTVVYSKNLKPLRNEWLQQHFNDPRITGLDGELIVGKPTGQGVFNRTSSGVTKKTGQPDVYFYVFDCFLDPEAPFSARLAIAELKVQELAGSLRVKFVPHTLVRNMKEYLAFEKKCLKEGYEGVMARSPDGPYKFGRATPKEGYLWKGKRFRDGEATVVRFEEAEQNTNEATKDELGRTKRSSAKAGKVAKGMVGTIVGKDTKTGEELRIGPGRLTEKMRKQLWSERAQHEGATVVKYRVFDYGAKDTPRFPTCQGICGQDDVSLEG